MSALSQTIRGTPCLLRTGLRRTPCLLRTGLRGYRIFRTCTIENLREIDGGPADTAGGVEEPVHEDPGVLVVGVVRQQPVPLELLLAGTVACAPGRGAHTVLKKLIISNI